MVSMPKRKSLEEAETKQGHGTAQKVKEQCPLTRNIPDPTLSPLISPSAHPQWCLHSITLADFS